MRLSRRQLEPELMDDPSLPEADLRAALSGLSRLNTISRAASSLWRHIRPLAATSPRPLRVLDIAVGSGDVLVGVAQRAQRAGIPLDLTACDIREEMLAASQARAAAAGFTLRTFRFDAMSDRLPTGFDVATTSLFCHHLPDEVVVSLFRSMAIAAPRLVVSDLCRSTFNLAQVWLGSRLLTRSRIVHVDSILSIRAAFTREEMGSLASRAGLRNIRAYTSHPARMILVADRPA